LNSTVTLKSGLEISSWYYSIPWARFPIRLP